MAWQPSRPPMHAAITPEPVPPAKLPPLPTPQELPPVRDPPLDTPPVHDPPSQPPVPVHAPLNDALPPDRHADCTVHPVRAPSRPTPMNPTTLNPTTPLPPLPYGAANHVWPQAARTLSEAIDAVHEHCRQIEWRRMAIALRQREQDAQAPPPLPH